MVDFLGSAWVVQSWPVACLLLDWVVLGLVGLGWAWAGLGWVGQIGFPGAGLWFACFWIGLYWARLAWAGLACLVSLEPACGSLAGSTVLRLAGLGWPGLGWLAWVPKDMNHCKIWFAGLGGEGRYLQNLVC